MNGNKTPDEPQSQSEMRSVESSAVKNHPMVSTNPAVSQETPIINEESP